MDVDFTPIFLAFFPLFLAVGTLLGLGLGQSASTAVTTTTPNVIVNVNSTSTATTTSTGSTSNATSSQPTLIYFLFTNGTLAAFPILSTGLTLGTTLFGGLFPFAGIGRSLSNSLWSLDWPDIYGLLKLHHDLKMLEKENDESRLDSVICSHNRNWPSTSLIAVLRLAIGVHHYQSNGSSVRMAFHHVVSTLLKGECNKGEKYYLSMP